MRVEVACPCPRCLECCCDVVWDPTGTDWKLSDTEVMCYNRFTAGYCHCEDYFKRMPDRLPEDNPDHWAWKVMQTEMKVIGKIIFQDGTARLVSRP